MAGNKKGGLKAAATNKKRHGEDFYVNIGRKGGTAYHAFPRGFAANIELASIAGAKGGRISRRTKRKSIAVRIKELEKELRELRQIKEVENE